MKNCPKNANTVFTSFSIKTCSASIFQRNFCIFFRFTHCFRLIIGKKMPLKGYWLSDTFVELNLALVEKSLDTSGFKSADQPYPVYTRCKIVCVLRQNILFLGLGSLKKCLDVFKNRNIFCNNYCLGDPLKRSRGNFKTLTKENTRYRLT